MVASPTTDVTNREPSGLLIYDGDCGFCTSAARRFDDLLGPSGSISAWQALDLGEFGLTEAEVSSAAYWVGADGRAYRGADAMANALKSSRQPWRFLGMIAAVPPVVWFGRALYPLVAKYRYRLPGSTNACRLEPPTT